MSEENSLTSSEEIQKPNSIRKSLKEWWDSDDYKQLQKQIEEEKQRAIGKYFMLSEKDKLDMVQAICTVMCNAENEGCSHRSLMDALGIYPTGFFITELMVLHNALHSYYLKDKNDKETQKNTKDIRDPVED